MDRSTQKQVFELILPVIRSRETVRCVALVSTEIRKLPEVRSRLLLHLTEWRLLSSSDRFYRQPEHRPNAGFPIRTIECIDTKKRRHIYKLYQNGTLAVTMFDEQRKRRKVRDLFKCSAPCLAVSATQEELYTMNRHGVILVWRHGNPCAHRILRQYRLPRLLIFEAHKGWIICVDRNSTEIMDNQGEVVRSIPTPFLLDYDNVRLESEEQNLVLYNHIACWELCFDNE